MTPQEMDVKARPFVIYLLLSLTVLIIGTVYYIRKLNVHDHSQVQSPATAEAIISTGKPTEVNTNDVDNSIITEKGASFRMAPVSAPAKTNK